MPTISEFYGIKITMYWDEHMPPHFHAVYGSYTVLVDIKNATVLKGFFPGKQLKLVLAWAELHKDELLQNWENALNNKELKKIAPLQ
jgi:hypothetical protein